MNAAGYIRVSDRREEAHGLGEESQRRAILEFCSFKGIEVDFVSPDIGVSGGKPLMERKGGFDLIARLEAGTKAVVVFKLDRLGRSVSDVSRWLEDFRSRGIVVLSVSENFDDGTLTGWLLSQFLMVFAEFERRTGSERMKALHKALGEMGRKRGGSVPFGYDEGPGKVLVANPGEQKWKRWMKSQRTRGWTDGEIAAELRAKKVPSKEGGRWRANTVRSILAYVDTKTPTCDRVAESVPPADTVQPDVTQEHGNDDVTWSEHGDAQP